jgi:hypothetical protein
MASSGGKPVMLEVRLDVYVDDVGRYQIKQG